MGWGAALGSLAAGFLGSKSNEKIADKANDQFRAQMDESIQRRVADAKKAGVHPLFALGASVGASPTIAAGGDNSMAAGVQAAAEHADSALQQWGNRKIAAVERDLGIRQAEANISRTEAERDLALAQAAASTDAMLRARSNVTQDLNGQMDDFNATSVQAGTTPPNRVTPTAPPEVSSKKMQLDQSAASNPSWEKQVVGVDRKGNKEYAYVPTGQSYGEEPFAWILGQLKKFFGTGPFYGPIDGPSKNYPGYKNKRIYRSHGRN